MWKIDRQRSIERIFGRKFSRATRVQLLWKGKDSFKTIFDAVAEAEEVICLQFYIFKNDGTGAVRDIYASIGFSVLDIELS